MFSRKNSRHGHEKDQGMDSVSPTGSYFTQRRRSISTPYLQELATVRTENSHDTAQRPEHKRKRFSFKNPFLKLSHHSHSGQSRHGNETPSSLSDHEEETAHRNSELYLIHLLMQCPDEVINPPCETYTRKTICASNLCSKQALQLNRMLCQMDICNTRITTLNHLLVTAMLASATKELVFVNCSLEPLQQKRKSLWTSINELMTVFTANPQELLSSGIEEDLGVVFFVSGENDNENDAVHPRNLTWLDCGQDPSSDSSSESESDGPTPGEVRNLAKQIRRIEVTRFKHHKAKGRHKRDSVSPGGTGGVSGHLLCPKPPPPNPLGQSNRAILRANTSTPAGLSQQSHSHLSSSSLSNQKQKQHHHQEQMRSSRTNPQNVGSHSGHHSKGRQETAASFNLLSLTGQLTWLISEFLEHGGPTHKWALDLVSSISKMSVTKSDWVNLHQQVRETTELLYNQSQLDHDRRVNFSDEIPGTTTDDAVWENLKTAYKSASDPESTTTMTATEARRFLTESRTDKSTKSAVGERSLVHLYTLVEKKYHLAYVCDLVLWKQHKNLVSYHTRHPHAVKEMQLIDLKIRAMQLKLDEANFQHWTQEFVDVLLSWLSNLPNPELHSKTFDINEDCLRQFRLLRNSVVGLNTLVNEICQSEFMEDNFWPSLEDSGQSTGDRTSELHVSKINQDSHRHVQVLRHHAQTGERLDIRPLDAESCSHTHFKLVRQIHDHSISKRPLSYFAKRTLYDIAIELECPVNWKDRLNTLVSDLSNCYAEWELLLQHQLGA